MLETPPYLLAQFRAKYAAEQRRIAMGGAARRTRAKPMHWWLAIANSYKRFRTVRRQEACSNSQKHD